MIVPESAFHTVISPLARPDTSTFPSPDQATGPVTSGSPRLSRADASPLFQTVVAPPSSAPRIKDPFAPNTAFLNSPAPAPRSNKLVSESTSQARTPPKPAARISEPE